MEENDAGELGVAVGSFEWVVRVEVRRDNHGRLPFEVFINDRWVGRFDSYEELVACLGEECVADARIPDYDEYIANNEGADAFRGGER